MHSCDRDIISARIDRDQWVKWNTISAVWAQGEGATLKYVEFEQNWITLKPANKNYPMRSMPIDQVDIQNIVVGVHRNYLSS